MYYFPSNRFKLLIITPYPVAPADTGAKIRVVEIARHLSAMGLNVTILTPFKPGQRKNLRDYRFFSLRQVIYPFFLPLFFTDRPFPYGYLISFHPGYGFMFSKFIRSFDIFQFESVSFANLLRYIPSCCPVIYDAHNVDYDYFRSECRHPIVRRIVENRIFSLEYSLVQRSLHILTCSAKEKERFIDLYKISESKFSVVPNGIKKVVPAPQKKKDALYEIFPNARQFPIHAIFSGSNVEHNRIAVKLILKKFAMNLSKDCAFIIHGSCGNTFKKSFFLNNVFFDPSNDGFERYSHTGIIGLNPITQGSGTNLKVINYLAHGLSVISTDFGMRGYDDLKPYVITCPTSGFVKALLSKPVPPIGLSEALQSYLWKNIVRKMIDIYR